MRVAALIIGIFLSIILFLQSCTIATLGIAAESLQSAGGAERPTADPGASFGVLAALLSVLGTAFVLKLPRVAAVLFGMAFGSAWIGAGLGFVDLKYYRAAFPGLMVLAVLGRRELRRAQRWP